MKLTSKSIKKEGRILLFDSWHPQSECRGDDYKEKEYSIFGEVSINKIPSGYGCFIRWYRPRLFNMWRHYIGEDEMLFQAIGGGALKNLIRATNVYFNRNDDVDGGINEWEVDD